MIEEEKVAEQRESLIVAFVLRSTARLYPVALIYSVLS